MRLVEHHGVRPGEHLAWTQAYTAAQARAFYEQNSGAARSLLFVVGRFDAAGVETGVREAFSAMPKGTPAPSVDPKPHSERRIVLVDRPGAVQSTLVVGLPVVRPDEPDWVPLQVTHTLLGGYFSSRITANIREQKGYTYSPFSQLSTRVKDAYWAQNADVTTAVTGASLKEIFGEIDRLQAEPPPAAELKAVQNYLGGTFVLQNSARGGIVNQLLYVDMQGLGDEYLRTYIDKMNAVTPAQVSEPTGCGGASVRRMPCLSVMRISCSILFRSYRKSVALSVSILEMSNA